MANDEPLLESKVFRVVRRRYALADGRPAQKDCILHPGAVAIVPLLDGGRVCLIRNHRITVERTLLEVPAGTLEIGEDPAACAARELEEETGYAAGKLTMLTSFFMSPGILNERMHVFLATELQPGPSRRETGEEIDNCVVAWDEALGLVESGEIEDGKTIAALLYVDRVVP